MLFRSYTNRHLFGGAVANDGASSTAGLVEVSAGVLYGTTQFGGSNGQGGTVFKVGLAGGYELVRSFLKSSMQGAFPDAALLAGNDGALYGTTRDGGRFEHGTVFKLSRDEIGYTVLHDFGGSDGDGRDPSTRLVGGNDGMLYGTTQNGGPPPTSWGTVFKLSQDGGNYTVLKAFGFNSPEGSNPKGTLTFGSDQMLYGMAASGGGFGKGTLFRLATNGSSFTVLHSFNGGNGWEPNHLMEGSDGVLYGTTGFGGNTNAANPYGFGTVFKFNKDGTSFAVLRGFTSGTDAHTPHSLIEASDGVLYGTSEWGGTANEGTIFKLNKNGTGYTILHHFLSNSTDGGAPSPGLMEGPDGLLYGCARHGGNHGVGTIFRLSKNGSGFTNLYHFSGGSDGVNPRSGLVLANDGAFYGTTAAGGNPSLTNLFGDSGYGTLFKLSWPLRITRYERSGGSAAVALSGVPNWPYRIVVHTHLLEPSDAWSNWASGLTMSDGTLSVTNSENPSFPALFYRAVSP